jgi:hypothetical protein
MIDFVKDEMTLKTTLLIHNLMVISNALVSCVISFRKKPLITSSNTNTVFTRGNLNYCTNFLSMKHLDAPKSSNVLVFIVVDLLHLIVISQKNKVLSLNISWDHFLLHDALRYNLIVLIGIEHPRFSNPHDHKC